MPGGEQRRRSAPDAGHIFQKRKTHVVFTVSFKVERIVTVILHPWCGDQIGREHVTIEPAICVSPHHGEQDSPNQDSKGNVPDTSRPFTLRLNCFAAVPCSPAALADEVTSIRHVTMPKKSAVDDERRKLIEDMMMIAET